MDKRLERLFAESRERHSVEKKTEEKKEKTLEELKLDRARIMRNRYNSYDRRRFGVNNDLTNEWIAEHILDGKCEYCSEDNWNNLGCDRIDNSKPHTKDNVICACVRCNRLRGDKFTVDEMKEIGEVIKKIEKRNTVFRVAKKKGKSVAKIDKFGNVVKIYPSTIEAQVDGYKREGVSKAANNYVTPKGQDYSVYKGYYWKFV